MKNKKNINDEIKIEKLQFQKLLAQVPLNGLNVSSGKKWL